MGHSVILVGDSDWQISYEGKESLKPVLNEEIRGFCDIDTTLKLLFCDIITEIIKEAKEGFTVSTSNTTTTLTHEKPFRGTPSALVLNIPVI